MGFFNFFKSNAEQPKSEAPVETPAMPEKQESEEEVNAGWWASEIAEQSGKEVGEIERMLELPQDSEETLGVDEKLTASEVKNKLSGKIEEQDLARYMRRIKEKELAQTEEAA